MQAESRIAIESDADVVTARQRARELAGDLDLSSTDQTLLATAISEVARNITHYATRGEVRHLTVQFSVFSHLFVEAQLRKVIRQLDLQVALHLSTEIGKHRLQATLHELDADV